MKAPGNCSIVLVAGSALKELFEIKLTVESLGEQLRMVPYMMVLLVEDTNTKMNLKTTTNSNRFPPMVRCMSVILILIDFDTRYT